MGRGRGEGCRQEWGADIRELGKERAHRTASMQRNACAAQESISGLLVLKREMREQAEGNRDYMCVHLQEVLFTPLSPHMDCLLPNTPEELGLSKRGGEGVQDHLQPPLAPKPLSLTCTSGKSGGVRSGNEIKFELEF